MTTEKIITYCQYILACGVLAWLGIDSMSFILYLTALSFDSLLGAIRSFQKGTYTNKELIRGLTRKGLSVGFILFMGFVIQVYGGEISWVEGGVNAILVVFNFGEILSVIKNMRAILIGNDKSENDIVLRFLGMLYDKVGDLLEKRVPEKKEEEKNEEVL